MLGVCNSPFDSMLGELLGQLNRPNLLVHPETADYLPYYVAADLFVCSSYEEIFPRVILETMACETPILSSSVQGVPELVRPDPRSKLWFPPGDTVALLRSHGAVAVVARDAVAPSRPEPALASSVNSRLGILLLHAMPPWPPRSQPDALLKFDATEHGPVARVVSVRPGTDGHNHHASVGQLERVLNPLQAAIRLFVPRIDLLRK